MNRRENDSWGRGYPLPVGSGRGGMTLTELLVALAVLAILFSLLFMPLMKSFGYMHIANVRVNVQQSANMVLEAITQDLAQATDVYVLDTGDSYDPSRASLVMMMPRGTGAAAGLPGASSSGLSLPDRPWDLEPGIETPLIVHYSIGLTHAAKPYANGFEQEPSEPGGDNLYRVLRAEYYPYARDLNNAPPTSRPFVLWADAGASTAQSTFMGHYEVPHWMEALGPRFLDDSRFQAAVANTTPAQNRRQWLEEHGLVVGLTSARNVDAAWGTRDDNGTPDDTTDDKWIIRPGLRFESLDSKKHWRVTVSLRAYDTDGGKAYPFQVSTTVHALNVR